jgi:hypothetical protein
LDKSVALRSRSAWPARRDFDEGRASVEVETRLVMVKAAKTATTMGDERKFFIFSSLQITPGKFQIKFTHPDDGSGAL